LSGRLIHATVVVSFIETWTGRKVVGSVSWLWRTTSSKNQPEVIKCQHTWRPRERSLQRRRVDESECQIDRRGRRTVRVLLDLSGVQGHSQPNQFFDRMRGVMFVQRGD
jgi:hypothetical protein